MNQDQPAHIIRFGRDRGTWPHALFATVGFGIRWDMPCAKTEPTPAAFTFALKLRLPGRLIVPLNSGKYLSLWPIGALRIRLSFRPALIRWGK